MKKSAKILSAFVTIFSVILLCISPVSAESYFQSKGFQFLLTESKNAVICGYTGTEQNIEIPQSLGGYTVEKIADYAFSNNDNIKSVDFSKANGLVNIGISAFAGCTQLESALLTDSIAMLGTSCFQGCTSLEEVTFGRKLADIPAQAFYNCTSLSTVTIPQTVESVGSNAFGGCTALISVLFSSDNVSIRQNAFSGCPDLVLYGNIDSSACLFADAENLRFFNMDENLMNDINGDGQENVNDVTYIQMYLAEFINYDTRISLVAEKLDTNNDGVINVTDVTYLQKILVDMI